MTATANDNRNPRPVIIPVEPLALIREAIEWAMVEGLRVELLAPNQGIVCVSTEGNTRWARDPMSRHVSPVGAAVLKIQPETTNFHAACAAAVGGSIPLCEGLFDGTEGGEPAGAFLSLPCRTLYLQGYQIGVALRRIFTRQAADHRTDEDCARAFTLDPAGNCFACGAVAVEPCIRCGKTRFHVERCPEAGQQTGRA